MSIDPSSGLSQEPDRVYLLAFPADFTGSESSLSSLIATLSSRWRFLLIVGLIGAVVAYAASFASVSRYQSESLVVVADTDQGRGLLGSVLSGFGASSAMSTLGIGMPENLKDEAMAYLRSQEFAEKVIAKYELIPELFPERRFSVGRLIGDRDRVPTRQEAVRAFAKHSLRVAENRSAGTVSIGIVLPNRDRTAPVVNGLIADLNDEMRSRTVSEADLSLAFLQKEADAAGSLDVKQTIFKLMEGQYRRRMLANVRRDFVFRIVDPAATPDPRDRVSPRRPFWAIAGFGLAFALGCLWLLIRHVRQLAKA